MWYKFGCSKMTLAFITARRYYLWKLMPLIHIISRHSRHLECLVYLSFDSLRSSPESVLLFDVRDGRCDWMKSAVCQRSADDNLQEDRNLPSTLNLFMTSFSSFLEISSIYQ